jgi:PAS domain S-box-containing protein
VGGTRLISVLHVDDEEDFLVLSRICLQREGDIRIDGVNSAGAALERLRETRYDAIISDYQMPGMDGIALLKRLREGGDRTPFIILTGRGREQVAIEALNSGADFYLQKGTDPGLQFIELRNLILQAVTRRQAMEALVVSEERYRNLAETSQDFIYIIGADDRVAYLNTHALKLLGRKEGEVTGRPRGDLFPARVSERMKEHLARVFSEGEAVRVEDSIPVGGSEFWLDTTLIPLRDPKGTITSVMGISRDITGRKQIEDALRESEERWKTLFERSAVPQMLMDGGIVIDCNAAFLALFALKNRETVLGHRPGEFAPPVQPDGTPSHEKGEEIQRAFLEQGSARYEWAHLKHDAARTPILTEVIGTIVLIRGHPLVHVIVLDITERRRIEDALRESEKKYRTLVERAHEGIIVVQDSLVKFCNRRTAEMWGGECREILGRPYRDFVDPRELPRLRENYERRMAGKEVPGRYDTRLLKKDGTSFPVDLDGGDITFDGRMADFIMFRDITDRKRAEEALRESEEKYRALVERANDGIVVVRDGVVTFCNRRAAELWGGETGEIVGRPFQDFIDPDEVSRIREIYERRMAGEGVPSQYDALLRRKDGSRFHGELNAGRFIFEGKPADLVLFRDITERKLAEEALKNANRKLNLLSTVTRHDILNQIMVVTGYLELAGGGSSLDEVKGLLDLAGKAAVTMRRQLDFARQYQDIGVRSPVWQDLREVIARALPGSGTRVKILLEMAGVRVYADPLLERVFSNLLENALIHGKKVTTIRLSARVTDGALTILCGDDGIGIPAREKERIFAPGYGRNTGYGLFLVREILGITGATIREIGEEGKGALFEITIPGDAYRVGE